MSNLEETLARHNPIQYLIEHNRPFRPQGPFYPMTISPLIRASQVGSNIVHMMPYLERSLRHTDMTGTPDIELHAIELSALLQNLAWHEGPHLNTIVSLVKG